MKRFALILCVLLLTGCARSELMAPNDENSVSSQQTTVEKDVLSEECTLGDPTSDEKVMESIEEMPTSDATSSDAVTLPLSGHIICIDPGHCVTPLSGKGMTGPISPLSDAVKPLYTEGTEGIGLTEEKLNLIVGLKLRTALEDLGAVVLMTREVSEITITGIQRCEIANEGGADVNIHIHADGIDDTSVHGVCVLVPSGDLLGTPSIVPESVRLGKLMVDCVAEETGAKNRGISPRSDMTGFNFSEVPSVLIEMGFMTNPDEDTLLETDEYQNLIVNGIVRALLLWFET